MRDIEVSELVRMLGEGFKGYVKFLGDVYFQNEEGLTFYEATNTRFRLEGINARDVPSGSYFLSRQQSFLFFRPNGEEIKYKEITDDVNGLIEFEIDFPTKGSVRIKLDEVIY